MRRTTLFAGLVIAALAASPAIAGEKIKLPQGSGTPHFVAATDSAATATPVNWRRRLARSYGYGGYRPYFYGAPYTSYYYSRPYYGGYSAWGPGYGWGNRGWGYGGLGYGGWGYGGYGYAPGLGGGFGWW